MNAWRLPVLAAAVVLGGVCTASAQTVMVRHVPPGSTVEAVINTGTPISGTANPDGDATLIFPAAAPFGPDNKGEMDANIFLDTCKAIHRVVIFDRTKSPPAAAEDCDRREITGVFWVRRVNTIVVDTATTTPSLLLIRGKYTPPPPPKPESATGDTDEETHKPRSKSPVGPLIFGGTGLGTFDLLSQQQCGAVTPCTVKDRGLVGTAGLQFWIKEWLGVEGSYFRPPKFTANGGDTFSFNTSVNTDIYSVSGLVGAPLGLVRPYAKGGMNFTTTSLNTVETIAVATQTIAYRTRGWGYSYGGGADITISKRLTGFAEVDIFKLNGSVVGGGNATLNDRYTSVVFGARLRLLSSGVAPQ